MTKEVESTITNCTVKDVEFISSSEILLLGNIQAESKDEPVAKSCSVIKCTVLCSSKHCQIVFFIEYGTVKNCFVSNLKIYGDSTRSRSEVSISQSYVEAEIVGEFKNQDLYEEFNTAYADITQSDPPEEKQVTISKASDLESVNVNDEVVLQKDVDCSEIDVNLPVRFSGHFDGNQHTIHNLNSALFRRIERATVENLTINNPEPSVYTRKGGLVHIPYVITLFIFKILSVVMNSIIVKHYFFI